MCAFFSHAYEHTFKNMQHKVIPVLPLLLSHLTTDRTRINFKNTNFIQSLK